MPEFGSNIEQNVFRVFVSRLNTAYDNFEKKLSDYVSGQLALGRSRQEVLQELTDNLNNGQAIFKDLLSSVEREMDWGLNLEYQAASNIPQEPVKPGAGMRVWTLNPAAEHCDSCLYQASLPARDIGVIPIPGTQPTVGEKNCGPYCRCTLEPVSELEAA